MPTAATHWNDLVADYDPVISSDPMYRQLLSEVIRLVPPESTNILDLGCGTGTLTSLCSRAFTKATVVGIDPAPNMIDQARRKNRCSSSVIFEEGTAADLNQFRAESFDAVVSNFALHHLKHAEKKKCAAESFRVLRPGGRFINADQHCQVMGEIDDPARVLHIVELLTAKAKFYFQNAGLPRMLLQLELLPRFIKEDGEILATPQFWREALIEAQFQNVEIEIIEPAELMNRVIWGQK